MKVNFSDFTDYHVVGPLKRKLFLDISQFDGIPGAVELKSVKVQLLDRNKGQTFENVSYYEFSASDFEQVKAIASMPGIPENVKAQLLANVPRVYFRVNIHGGEDENAKKNFNFITGQGLDETVGGRILSGVKWAVAWQYGDQYHGDVLGLVIPDVDGIKVYENADDMEADQVKTSKTKKAIRTKSDNVFDKSFDDVVTEAVSDGETEA